MVGLNRPLILLFAVLHAQPVAAEFRLEVKARAGGKIVQGSQACFYPYRIYDPFTGLEAPGYRCLPADKLISIPAGKQFAFFARHPSGLTSSNPIGFSPPAVAEGFRTFVFDLAPSGTIDFSGALASIQSNEQLALIVGPSATSGSYTLPVAETKMILPVGVQIVPVVMRDGSVVAVGKSLQLRPGEMKLLASIESRTALVLRILPADPLSGLPPALSATLCEKPYSEESSKLLSAQEPPIVKFVDAQRETHAPVFDPHITGQMVTGLYVFYDVAAGNGVLQVGGPRWRTATRSMVVREGANAMREPIVAGLGSAFSVTTSGAVHRFLGTSGQDCAAQGKAKKAEPVVGIARCAADDPDGQNLTRCTDVAVSPLRTDGVYNFEGLEPGHYTGFSRVGDMTVAYQRVKAPIGETAEVTLAEPSSFFVTGRVTIDGRPLHGELKFRTGAAVSSESGEYLALLPKPPVSRVIRFTSCDQTIHYQHTADTPIVSGSIVDIEIPSNEVLVDVRDRQSGKQLANAQALVAVLTNKDDPEDVAYFAPGLPEDGKYLARNLAAGRPFRVCAELEGYEYHCAPEIRIKKSGRESATVMLEKVSARRGQVLETGYRDLYWTNGNGIVTEAIKIAEDGSFRYQRDHPPTEFVVLVGSAPLYVGASPPLAADGSLQISPQVRSTTTIALRLGAGSTRRQALVALWINGVLLPNQALVNHQMIRRERFLIVGPDATVIREIPSGGILAAAGPDPQLLPRGTDLRDPSLFLGVERKRVVGAEIVFD